MKTSAAVAMLGAMPSMISGFSLNDLPWASTSNPEWDDRMLAATNYVQVIFPVGIPSQFSSAFTGAAAFWNNVLSTAPVSPLVFSSPFSVAANLPGCGVDFTFSAGSSIIGLTIFAEVEPIDGVNGILGQAGPCGFTGNFPRLGIMSFDSADVQAMLNDGSLTDVIIHEMGHVLGIGGQWQSFGLLNNPCTTNPCRTNPTYKGANGKAGFSQLGGSGNVPVENTGGPGTFNAHWRESTFRNELMTGFLNAGDNPLSIMTVRSLVDLGYNVNLNAAEAYALPRPGDVVVNGEIEMVGDMLDITPVDMEPIIAANEAKNKSKDLVVFVAVAATLMAVLVAFVAFVAIRMKRQNEAVLEEIKNMELQSQVESFTPPPARSSRKVMAPAEEEAQA